MSESQDARIESNRERMDNIVTIGSNQDASAAQAAPAATAGEGLLVTSSAVRRIRAILTKEGIPFAEGGLRLGVKGGGCSGLSYAVAFDAHPRERDNIFNFEDVRVFIDPKSFVFLKGMTLDYEETLIRQGFNFINPNSTKSCGCGTSFSV
jgi:iron-sulfur cluster assembly protein